jgi:hypothetical protein
LWHGALKILNKAVMPHTGKINFLEFVQNLKRRKSECDYFLYFLPEEQDRIPFYELGLPFEQLKIIEIGSLAVTQLRRLY